MRYRREQRFVAGEARFPTVRKEILAGLAKKQRPYTTVIGCSDSPRAARAGVRRRLRRTVHCRVAGNVISPEVMGTLQYAAVHLHTPLFVVLGHEGCGAIQAALARSTEAPGAPPDRNPPRPHLPRSARAPRGLTGEARLTAAVEANVRWSMKQLRDTPEGQARMKEGILKLVGAVYELKTGERPVPVLGRDCRDASPPPPATPGTRVPRPVFDAGLRPSETLSRFERTARRTSLWGLAGQA